MRDSEIKDHAQKLEDALLHHDDRKVEDTLHKEMATHSKDDVDKIITKWKEINDKDRAHDSSLPSLDITHDAHGSAKDVVLHDPAAGVSPKSIDVSAAASHAGLSAAEAAALGLFAGMVADSIPTPAQQQAAIDAGDQAAGRVNNLSVVSDGDLGDLEAAYGNISGLTPDGQFAQARVGAAIDAARNKLAAAKTANQYNPADSADYAQQFGSPEAYEAYKRQQAKDKSEQEK